MFSATRLVDENVVKRYGHAEFVTIPAVTNNQDDDNSNQTTANTESADNKSAESSKKIAALSGESDHYFKATVTCEGQPILVAGGARKNQRDYMEDRYDVARLTSVNKLNDTDLYELSRRNVAQLQKECINPSSNHCGSTYTNVIVDLVKARLIVTQVGDSEAWLEWEDEQGEIRIIQLHPCVHQVNDPHEMARLKRAGHEPFKDVVVIKKIDKITKEKVELEIINYRLRERGLIVSRAIGDNDSEDVGLLHDPSVNIYSYAHLFSKAKKIRVIVRSDGFHTPDNKMAEELLAAKLSVTTNRAHTDLLAKQLLENEKASDNTALLIAELPLKKLEAADTSSDDSALSLSIFDGHGSDYVSHMCAQRNFVIQQTAINDLLKEKHPTNDIRAILHTALDVQNPTIEDPVILTEPPSPASSDEEATEDAKTANTATTAVKSPLKRTQAFRLWSAEGDKDNKEKEIDNDAKRRKGSS